jgi:predicted RNA binding protein YcfA (HicA-like mRNA interferase family)
MKLPPMTAREITTALTTLGFEKKRQSGSHMIYRHPLTRTTIVVPDHGGKELKKGTLRGIIKQSNVTVEEFVKAARS